MASSAPVELDFLGLRPAAGADHHGGGNGTTSTASSSSSSIRGMKTSAIASIGARQLRRVIAGGGTDTPAAPPRQAPMTLFYNGTVATFDGVSQDKAEAIMKMAMDVVTASNGGRAVRAGNAFADMPLTRTKSLQQFLQKRKERLSGVGPYQQGLGGTSRVGGAAATKSSRVKEEAA